jgi:gamma-tubulin complex component 3
MKYSCQDSEWVVTRQRSHGSESRPRPLSLDTMADACTALQYADMAGLERSITLAYSVASQRLFDIFFDKFRLLDHLKALKDYLMLGKGDFVEILMENLG